MQLSNVSIAQHPRNQKRLGRLLRLAHQRLTHRRQRLHVTGAGGHPQLARMRTKAAEEGFVFRVGVPGLGQDDQRSVRRTHVRREGPTRPQRKPREGEAESLENHPTGHINPQLRQASPDSE